MSSDNRPIIENNTALAFILRGQGGSGGSTGPMGATGPSGSLGPTGPVGVTGPAGASTLSGGQNVLNVAPSSLVQPNVGLRSWERYLYLGNPTGQSDRVSLANNNAANGSYDDRVSMNFDASAVGDGSRAHQFCIPASATGVQVNFPLSFGSSGAAATVVVQILNPGRTVLASQAVTTTSSLVTTTLTLTGLTGPMELVARVLTNNTTTGTSAQATVSVGTVTAVPTGAASGVFSSGFTRIEVEPGNMWNCGICDFLLGMAYRTNEFASFVIDTDATAIAIEFLDTMQGSGVSGASNNDPIIVYVNGRPFTTVSGVQPTGSAANAFLNCTEISLAALGGGLKRIEIINGSQQQGTSGTPTPHFNPVGTFLRAAYVPSGNLAHVIPQPRAERRLVFMCDSLYNGTTNANAGLVAAVTQLRYGGVFEGSVASVGYGGNSLQEWAETPQAIQQSIARLRAFDPTDIWLDLGANDAESTGSYQAYLQALLPALHTAMPAANIWYATLSTGFSATIRTAQIQSLQTVAAADTSSPQAWWLVMIDGLQMWQSTYTHSGNHPTVLGIGQEVSFLLQALTSVQPWQIPTCILSWDASDAVVTAGTISALADRSSAANGAAASAVATKSSTDTLWAAGYTPPPTVVSYLTSTANLGMTGDALFTVMTGIAPGDTATSYQAWTIGGAVANTGVGLAVSLPSAGDFGVINGDGSGDLTGVSYKSMAQLVTLVKFQTGAFNAAFKLRQNGLSATPTGSNASSLAMTDAALTWGATASHSLILPNGKPFIAVWNSALWDGLCARLEHAKAVQFGMGGF